jgi:hypothetical protein
MKNLFFIWLVCYYANALFGQTDSLTKSVGETDLTHIKHKRIYKLFVEGSNHEIKHLFKINISPLIILRPTIAFEQKLGKNFSSETSISYKRCSYLYFVSDLFLVIMNMDSESYNSPVYPNGSSFRGYQMIKYYHNLNARQIFGQNTNGFTGNFFAAQLLVIYANSGTERNYDGTPFRKENYYFTFYGFSYGFQQRIGNIGYFEPSLYLDILYKTDFENLPFFTFGAKFKMGFAIESVNSLGKMLKK